MPKVTETPGGDIDVEFTTEEMAKIAEEAAREKAIYKLMRSTEIEKATIFSIGNAVGFALGGFLAGILLGKLPGR